MSWMTAEDHEQKIAEALAKILETAHGVRTRQGARLRLNEVKLIEGWAEQIRTAVQELSKDRAFLRSEIPMEYKG